MFQGFSSPHMDGFTMLGLDVESSSWHDGFILVYVIEVILIVTKWDMRYWIVHLIVVNFLHFESYRKGDFSNATPQLINDNLAVKYPNL